MESDTNLPTPELQRIVYALGDIRHCLVKLIEPVIQLSDRSKLLKFNNICLPEKIENYELGINEYARIAVWGSQERYEMEVGYLKYFTLSKEDQKFLKNLKDYNFPIIEMIGSLRLCKVCILYYKRI